MFGDKALKYSYQAQKTRRHRFLRVSGIVLLCFFVYLCFTTLLFSMNVMENASMMPGIRRGDRFVCLSTLIGPEPARGAVVLVDRAAGAGKPWPGLGELAADEALRFITAQRISLRPRSNRVFLKRLIGLPGDEISMTNFIIRVKPADSPYRLTEFELIPRLYDVNIPQLPALWDESLPFSGNMDPIVLKDDECFVVSDDRNNTSDSRSWGPIPVKALSGRVLFRYWPLTRLGRP